MANLNFQKPTTESLRRWSPINVAYVPSPPQLAFHQDRGKVQERGLQAGTGGGKTYAAAFEVLDITLRERSDVAILAAPDYPQLELSIYSTLKKLLGRPLTSLEPYASFNASRKRLYWWNGWEWRFASMQDPTSVEGLPEAAVVWLNEARLMRDFDGPDGPWLNLTRRLRGVSARNRHAIFDTHSPTQAITRAFKPKTIQRLRVNGGIYEVTQCMDVNRRLYQWGTKDAMAWGTLDVASGERILGAYVGTAAQRILEGRFARPGGLVFDAFDHERNVKEWRGTPEAMTYGVDWGWSHPTVVTAHAWVGDVVHTVAEWVMTRSKDVDILAAILALQARFGEGTVWCGADRPEGIDALRNPASGGRGVDARSYVGKVDDGVTLLNGRLAAGSWLIDPACVELLRGLDEWERDKETRQVKKQDGADDAPDSARYGIVGGVSYHASKPLAIHRPRTLM